MLQLIHIKCCRCKIFRSTVQSVEFTFAFHYNLFPASCFRQHDKTNYTSSYGGKSQAFVPGKISFILSISAKRISKLSIKVLESDNSSTTVSLLNTHYNSPSQCLIAFYGDSVQLLLVTRSHFCAIWRGH